MNLTVIVITKNEEKNITECLKSISFADEIIVIDDYSQDFTFEIAEKFTKEVYKRRFQGNFSEQRNYGLKKAKGKWILFIDADERVSSNLKNEIMQVVDNPFNEYDGYKIFRYDTFLNKKLNFGEWGGTPILRLAKKDKGIWKRRVHEKWEIKGRVSSLKAPLDHYPHKNLKEFIKKINIYSNLHFQAKLDENKKSSIGKIIFFPIAKFLQNWVFKQGFRDGDHGFIMSLMMSFHSFLSWSKLWLKQRE